MTQEENRLIEEFWQGKSLGKDVYISDFSRSWDLLMPVVEKIGEEYDVTIANSEYSWVCNIHQIDPFMTVGAGARPIMVEAVWNGVIEFIKWFNKKDG